MRLKGSITVMMTMVLTIILAFMLVILEHDYRICLKTLELQGLDRAIESTLGNFYAPLWNDYGLIAVPVGEGFYYEDEEAIENQIKENYNFIFENQNDFMTFLWKSEIEELKLNNKATFTSNSGHLFIRQLEGNINYDLAIYATGEISELAKNGKIDLMGMTIGAKDEIKRPEEDEDDSEQSEEPDEKSSYSKAKKTLKAFLKDGFAGWWFEDNESLSDKKISKKDLPSVKYAKGGDEELFGEINITDADFDDDEYVNYLTDEELVDKFNEALNSFDLGSSDKLKLLFYANQYFGNYAHAKTDTELRYEQEYLIFGNVSDETNVKRASWAIFAIREAINLVAITKSPVCQAKLSEWLGIFDVVPLLSGILKGLAITVWSTQNALVETAAICKGKAVDFYTSDNNLSVKLSEVLSMSKDKIQKKAKAYKKSEEVGFSYESYLMVFMFMNGTEKLSYRMMDLIELNMKKRYNTEFSLDKCLVGLGVRATAISPSKYLSVPYASVGRFKGLRYHDSLESAIYYGD